MLKLAIILGLATIACSFGFSNLISPITDAASATTSLASSVSDIVSSATTQIQNVGQNVIRTTTSALQQLSSQTAGIISDATNSVSNTVNSAVSTATKAASDAVQTVMNTANNLVSQVQNAASDALNFVQQKVNTFIGQINDLSNYMCENQCTSFFNLPCFLLFRCSDKIKKFFLLLVAPIFVVIIIFVGFFSGLFNISCFCKFLGTITGIYPIILIVRCVRKKNKAEEMKEEALKQARAELEKISKHIKNEQETSKHFKTNQM